MTSVTSSPDALIVTPDDFVTCVYSSARKVYLKDKGDGKEITFEVFPGRKTRGFDGWFETYIQKFLKLLCFEFSK